MTEPLTEWFHQAALAVAFIAAAEGWLPDSERVRRAVYHLYEHGELPPEPTGRGYPPPQSRD